MTNFFKSIQDMLLPYRENPKKVESEAAQRINRLQDKYFMAGESAWVMFDLEPLNATNYLQTAIAAVPDIKTCVEILVGNTSPNAVNWLVVVHPQNWT